KQQGNYLRTNISNLERIYRTGFILEEIDEHLMGNVKPTVLEYLLIRAKEKGVRVAGPLEAIALYRTLEKVAANSNIELRTLDLKKAKDTLDLLLEQQAIQVQIQLRQSRAGENHSAEPGRLPVATPPRPVYPELIPVNTDIEIAKLQIHASLDALKKGDLRAAKSHLLLASGAGDAAFRKLEKLIHYVDPGLRASARLILHTVRKELRPRLNKFALYLPLLEAVISHPGTLDEKQETEFSDLLNKIIQERDTDQDAKELTRLVQSSRERLEFGQRMNSLAMRSNEGADAYQNYEDLRRATQALMEDSWAVQKHGASLLILLEPLFTIAALCEQLWIDLFR